jgi:DNA-binding MarR family transcriptional regulator
MKKLNPTTYRVYVFIRDYIAKNESLSPTLREIAEGCHMGHTSILPHLAKLEAMEWIIREIGRARTIRLGSRAPDAR